MVGAGVFAALDFWAPGQVLLGAATIGDHFW